MSISPQLRNNLVFLQDLDPQRQSVKIEEGEFKVCQKRSGLSNFFHWVVYILTFTFVPRNREIDTLSRSIIQGVGTLLSQASPLRSEDKTLIKNAATHLSSVIKLNGGRFSKKVADILSAVEKVQSQASSRVSELVTEPSSSDEDVDNTIPDQGPFDEGIKLALLENANEEDKAAKVRDLLCQVQSPGPLTKEERDIFIRMINPDFKAWLERNLSGLPPKVCGWIVREVCCSIANTPQSEGAAIDWDFWNEIIGVFFKENASNEQVAEAIRNFPKNDNDSSQLKDFSSRAVVALAECLESIFERNLSEELNSSVMKKIFGYLNEDNEVALNWALDDTDVKVLSPGLVQWLVKTAFEKLDKPTTILKTLWDKIIKNHEEGNTSSVARIEAFVIAFNRAQERRPRELNDLISAVMRLDLEILGKVFTKDALLKFLTQLFKFHITSKEASNDTNLSLDDLGYFIVNKPEERLGEVHKGIENGLVEEILSKGGRPALQMLIGRMQVDDRRASEDPTWERRFSITMEDIVRRKKEDIAEICRLAPEEGHLRESRFLEENFDIISKGVFASRDIPLGILAVRYILLQNDESMLLLIPDDILASLPQDMKLEILQIGNGEVNKRLAKSWKEREIDLNVLAHHGRDFSTLIELFPRSVKVELVKMIFASRPSLEWPLDGPLEKLADEVGEEVAKSFLQFEEEYFRLKTPFVAALMRGWKDNKELLGRAFIQYFNRIYVDVYDAPELLKRLPTNIFCSIDVEGEHIIGWKNFLKLLRPENDQQALVEMLAPHMKHVMNSGISPKMKGEVLFDLQENQRKALNTIDFASPSVQLAVALANGVLNDSHLAIASRIRSEEQINEFFDLIKGQFLIYNFYNPGKSKEEGIEMVGTLLRWIASKGDSELKGFWDAIKVHQRDFMNFKEWLNPEHMNQLQNVIDEMKGKGLIPT